MSTNIWPRRDSLERHVHHARRPRHHDQRHAYRHRWHPQRDDLHSTRRPAHQHGDSRRPRQRHGLLGDSIPASPPTRLRTTQATSSMPLPSPPPPRPFATRLLLLPSARPPCSHAPRPDMVTSPSIERALGSAPFFLISSEWRGERLRWCSGVEPSRANRTRAGGGDGQGCNHVLGARDATVHESLSQLRLSLPPPGAVTDSQATAARPSRP